MAEQKTKKTESTTEKGFAEGKHVVLRPVLDKDLEDLAGLMAENPCEWEPTPWTHQRLKKQFEDKDKPGLWEKDNRTFAIVRRSGGVVGFLKEREDSSAGVYWCLLHIGEALEDRNTLGMDALSTYMSYKHRWHNPQRIAFDVLEPEEQKARWMLAHGFEHELTMRRAIMYRGEPAGVSIYSWFSEQLKNSPAWQEPAPGEGA